MSILKDGKLEKVVHESTHHGIHWDADPITDPTTAMLDWLAVRRGGAGVWKRIPEEPDTFVLHDDIANSKLPFPVFCNFVQVQNKNSDSDPTYQFVPLEYTFIETTRTITNFIRLFWKGLKLRENVSTIGASSFRRTGARQLVRNKVPEVDAKKMLGHSANSTQLRDRYSEGSELTYDNSKYIYGEKSKERPLDFEKGLLPPQIEPDITFLDQFLASPSRSPTESQALLEVQKAKRVGDPERISETRVEYKREQWRRTHPNIHKIFRHSSCQNREIQGRNGRGSGTLRQGKKRGHSECTAT